MADCLADALMNGTDLSDCLEVDTRESSTFKKVVKKSLELVASSKESSLPNNSIMTALLEEGTIPVKLTGKKFKLEGFVNGVKEMLIELGLVEAVGSQGSEGPPAKRARLTK